MALGLGGLLLLGSRQAAVSQQNGDAERGRYLVNHVAMCIQCHTPREPDGRLDRRKLLEGGSIPIESPYPDQVWGFEAPQLKGLPGWEVEDFVTLLTTGRRPDGRSPRPPMPPFRLSEEDARAIVAYLNSLE